MKKSLIALAVMAAAGAASAQSSVTLFGVVDLGFQHVSNNGGPNMNRMVSGAYNTSRLGVRGREDLGGGLAADFVLEAGIAADSGIGQQTNTSNQPTGLGPVPAGGLVFNRRSTVSLLGNWGEVRLGRDIVPQYWNVTAYDPFGTVGVGAAAYSQGYPNSTNAGVRASNSFGYLVPANLGGFYGQAAYWLGENPGGPPATEDLGEGFGARVGFKSGPFDVAVGYGRTEYAAGDHRAVNAGGSWDFGIARLMGSFARDKIGAATTKGFVVGAMMPVGPGEFKLAYSESRAEAVGADPRIRKLALGYVHNLSKRTAVYTSAALLRNKNGAAASVTTGAGAPAANGRSSGFDVGLRHAF